MEFLSITAALAILAGSQGQAEATCCGVNQAKAPVEVAQADGYICPITGQVLPCPSCCPAQAEK